VAGSGITTGSSDVLLSKVDVAPTLAEAAGTQLPWSVGTSFLPLLRGEPFEGRQEVLEVMPGSGGVGYTGWSALRTPEWRLIRWDDDTRELYDLLADPWEQRNLVTAEPEQAAAMEARLDELLETSAGSDARAPAAAPSDAPVE
jgi:arylsulfatase A-like enzyme